MLLAVQQSGAAVLQFAAEELTQDDGIMNVALDCRIGQWKEDMENPSWSPRAESGEVLCSVVAL